MRPSLGTGSASPERMTRGMNLGPLRSRFQPWPSTSPGAVRSAECDFRQASELARVQPFRFLRLQLRHRLEADLQVLADLPAVEFARHAGELDLALQRLVEIGRASCRERR